MNTNTLKLNTIIDKTNLRCALETLLPKRIKKDLELYLHLEVSMMKCVSVHRNFSQ